MFCLYCGNRLPDDATFCNKCGKAVNPSHPSSNPPPSSRITRDFNSPLVPPQSSSSGTSQPIIQAGPSSQPPVPPWQPQTGSGYQPTMQAGPASQPPPPPPPTTKNRDSSTKTA